MSKPVLVTAREFPTALRNHLETLADVRCFDSNSPDDCLRGASVWLGTAMDPVRADLIARFPDSLGLIANLGVGTDNIDVVAAAERDIHVSNTPVVTEDTADLTLALLLATARRLGECERCMRAGDWAGGAATMGRRVHGARLGIVGFGAIGQAVARRAASFDMQIAYHGPNRKADAEAATGATFHADLATLISESDFVSLNCPLTDATRHLINESTLATMKPGAILINTGRGPLIDEAALVTALRYGRIGGAGLDVFEFEPKVTPELMEFPNVVLLPHIGSATNECRGDIMARGLGNIAAFLNNGVPLDRVTAPTGVGG